MAVGDGGIYSLTSLLERNIPTSPPIIDQFLWDKDNVLIVGHEKAGKSILALQIAFAISSGQPLFGEYQVKRISNVLYVQTEGKLTQTIDRVKMMRVVNDVDPDKLYIAYYPCLALDTPEGMEMFRLDIDKTGFKPEVIIIDPLYHAMQGSLIDEESARHMTSNMRIIMERYNCAIILVHHTHKPIRANDGKIVHEGDNSIFGSFVWKSWADHTFLFKTDRTKLRILSCDTQRSGDVVEYDELKLVDSPYLGFDRAVESGKTYETSVRKELEDSGRVGATREELKEKLEKVSMSVIDKSLRKLVEIGEAIKDNKIRPAKYWSKIHVSPHQDEIVTVVST